MPARLALALAGGLLVWASQPGLDLWPAAPLGVALLALATHGAGARRAALLGVVGSLAAFTPMLSWTGVYVGALPWLALSLLEALYGALLGLLCGIVPWRGRSYPWIVAGAWVTTELARSTTPYGGFPWGRLAFGVTRSPLVRVAAWLGAPGVSFVVALVGGLLAVGLARLVGPRLLQRRTQGDVAGTRPRGAWPAFAGAAALTVAPLAIPLPTDGPTARVSAIQGNVPQAGLDFNAERRAVLDDHAAVTRELARQNAASGERAPDVVLWPENASDIDPTRNADAADVIAGAVAAIGAPTVVGAVLAEPVDHVTNAALVYEPGSRVPSQRYDKRHPVPFGEYIPNRDFFRLFSDKVDLVRRDFVGGDSVGVLRVPRAGGAPDLAIGANICFEVAYDDLVRDGVTHGANLIVVQTNNATFGDTAESVQQLAISRLRAVEHGRTVVHISNVGVSSIITPDGVDHLDTPTFAPATLTADVPLREDETLATRLGDAPAIVASLATLAAAGLAVAARRRATRS